MVQHGSPESLTQHTLCQGGLISLLLRTRPHLLRLTEPAPLTWSTIKDSHWGVGLEALQEVEDVERGENPVKDHTPPPTRSVVTPSRMLFALWNPLCQKVLVRDEYYKAEGAALSANEEGEDVFVVTGQPGIGLSLPLPRLPNLTFRQESLSSSLDLWVLMRRLALKLPTVVQVNHRDIVLFHEGGVSEFTDIDDPNSYKLLMPHLAIILNGFGLLWISA